MAGAVYPQIAKMFAYLEGEWVDITAYVISDVEYYGGIGGNTALDRIADAGTMGFTLRNTTGFFTEEGEHMLAGWGKGVPVINVIRFDDEDHLVRLYINESTEKIGVAGAKEVVVKAEDWMAFAAKHPFRELGTEVDKRADEALTAMLGAMAIPPQAMDFDEGETIFPAVFDAVTEKTRILAEMAALAWSDLGYIYVVPDAVHGETLVFENKWRRSGLRKVGTVPRAKADSGRLLKEDGGYLLKEDGGRLILDQPDEAAIVNKALDVETVNWKNLVNFVRATAHPKRIDTVPQVLFSLDKPMKIGAGQMIEFQGVYSDAAGGSRISAVSSLMEVPSRNPLSTIALLHFNGLNGSIVYEDEDGRTWTPHGNAQLSTAKYKFGGSSGSFDGDDYITTGHEEKFHLSNLDWNFDFYIYPLDLEKRGTIYSDYKDANNYILIYIDGVSNVSPVSGQWSCIACSDDGSFIIAGTAFSPSPSKLFISSNRGLNFTETIPGGTRVSWYACACDSDGSNLVAGAESKRLWTSSDYGNNWVERRPEGNNDRRWYGCASNVDGSILYACSFGYRVWKSIDGGANWSEIRPKGDVNANWRCIACSSDGQYVAVGNSDEAYIYISTDFGEHFTQHGSFGTSNNCCGVDISDDGQVILFGGSKRLFIIRNSGSDWEEIRPYGDIDKSYNSPRLSSDGVTCIISGYSMNPKISNDYGENWTTISSIGSGIAYELSKDGRHIILSTYSVGGQLYTLSSEIRFLVKSAGSYIVDYETQGIVLSKDTWHHISLARNGDTALIFLDGISQTIKVYISIAGKIIPEMTDGTVYIGSGPDNYGFKGYIDEFRFVINQYLWGGDFTPPVLEGVFIPYYGPDYVMNSSEQGNGTDLTDYLEVTAVYNAKGPFYTLFNSGPTLGWIWPLKARGLGVRDYNPIDVCSENATSIGKYSYHEESIDQLYQQDVMAGLIEGKKIVERERKPRKRLETVTLNANESKFMMQMCLHKKVGDLVDLRHDPSRIDGHFYIQAKRYILKPNKQLSVQWLLKEALSLEKGLSPITLEFSTTGETDGINFGYLPQVCDLAERTICGRIYVHDASTEDINYVCGTMADGGSNRVFVYKGAISGTIRIGFYSNLFNVAPGFWLMSDTSFEVDTWHDFAITYYPQDVNADPVFYLDNEIVNSHESATPAGSLNSEYGSNFMLGNIKTATLDYTYPMIGMIKDVRVYKRIIPAIEIPKLFVYEGNLPLITDGLVFHGPCVRTAELGHYEDLVLTADDPVLDNVLGAVGDAHGAVVARVI